MKNFIILFTSETKGKEGKDPGRPGTFNDTVAEKFILPSFFLSLNKVSRDVGLLAEQSRIKHERKQGRKSFLGRVLF